MTVRLPSGRATLRRVPAAGEARRHARARVSLKVTARDSDRRFAAELRFDSRDLSAGGAFVTARMLLEVGELLELELELPGGRRVRTGGRVARVVRAGAGRAPGMGIEFVGLPEDAQRALRELADGGGTGSQ